MNICQVGVCNVKVAEGPRLGIVMCASMYPQSALFPILTATLQ
jgi:hypothetical protein